MIYNLMYYYMFLFAISPFSLWAQNKTIELSLEQSFSLLQHKNKSLKIAEKAVEQAKNEHQKLNAFWYPSLNVTGAFVHLSNPIEVHQSLSQFTDPAQDYIHSLFPNEQIISSLLEQLGQKTLVLPLFSQNITSVDANLVWPLFTGGKRMYASKIGKQLVAAAEINQEQVGANQQTVLIESYFAVRLGQRIVEVKEATYTSLSIHYTQAVKLEQQGLINRAECLVAQVSMEEAKRELESAQKELEVANHILKSLINVEEELGVNPTTSLFINESIPSVNYFKDIIPFSNYIINQLKIQESITQEQLKIGRSRYFPNIAFVGKQTLYANGLDKYLVPRTMIGVAFTWNLFDGLEREKSIRQARLAGQTLLLEKDKFTTDLLVSVDKFYTQIQNAMDDVQALQVTLEMSKELLRIRMKSFQEGMTTSSEVVDAEVMLSKVKTAFLLAYFQYDVALANLLSICGIPEVFLQYCKEGKTDVL